MTAASGGRDRRGLFRPTAFNIGAAVGFVVALSLATLMLMPWAPRLNIDVISRGADISRRGGVKTVIATDERGALLTQVCKGVCDDIRLQASSNGEDGLQLKVLDSAGACIKCGGAGYLDKGLMTRVEISGETKLQFTDRDVADSRPAKPNGRTAPN